MKILLNFALGLAIVLLTGCAEGNRIKFAYSVSIPTDIPITITLMPEDAPPYQADGRQLYMDAHKRGWYGFMADFINYGFAEASTANPIPAQLFGIEARGQKTGREDCMAKIADLLNDYDESLIQTTLRDRYASELADFGI